ncbi:MAG: outer membrane beta-barrel protein [Gemmatimonadaceae bacterium]|nr:outer membrane beta-barrel protein [Gemmatimonadaceae bacterium]
MHRISFVAALGLAASVSASAVNAQALDGRSVHFGVMGGATRPVGDIAAYTNHDWSLGLLALIGSPQSRFNFRVDGQWQQLAGNDPLIGGHLTTCLDCNDFAQVNQQRFRVLDFTTNAVFNLTPASATSVYLVGGMGVYNERQADGPSGDAASVTRFGVNGGLGFKFRIGKLQPFVEARYHDIVGAHAFAAGPNGSGRSQTFQFIPINVGFVF